MLEIDASAVISGHVHTIVFKAIYDVMLRTKQYPADDVTLGRLTASIHFLFANTSDSDHEILNPKTAGGNLPPSSPPGGFRKAYLLKRGRNLGFL